jgi:hypothetical protein
MPPPARATRAAAVLIALSLLISCAPDPQPTPTPTPTPLFASDDEAFAAAEATYRAYNDALNQVDPTDPDTFEAVYTHTTGQFEEVDRKNLSAMHTEQLTIVGSNVVVGFRPLEASPLRDKVAARVCIDVSDVGILDTSGASRVNPERPAVYVADVGFEDERGTLVIDHATRSEALSCE